MSNICYVTWLDVEADPQITVRSLKVNLYTRGSVNGIAAWWWTKISCFRSLLHLRRRVGRRALWVR